MESEKELLVLIQNAAKAYDEADDLVNKIDDFCESISEKQSEVDSILSDLYHEIENDDLTDEQMASFGKEIKKYRKIRRGLDNANIVRNVYEKHKDKLPHKENRPFFRNSMKQIINDLNRPYKNRVLTNEDIENLKNQKVKTEKIKVKKIGKTAKMDVEKLKEELSKGKTQCELATIFNCSQPTINYWIKKIKKEEE